MKTHRNRQTPNAFLDDSNWSVSCCDAWHRALTGFEGSFSASTSENFYRKRQTQNHGNRSCPSCMFFDYNEFSIQTFGCEQPHKHKLILWSTDNE